MENSPNVDSKPQPSNVLATLLKTHSLEIINASDKNHVINSDKLDSLIAAVNALTVKIDALQNLTQNATAPSKKGIKTTTTSTNAENKPPDTDGFGKVTNALLFFRKMVALNMKGYREKYLTADILTAASTNATVVKRSETKESKPEEYWSAIAATSWPRIGNSNQDMIRSDFVKWKEEIQSKGANAKQLTADNTEVKVD
jgi:hypothetical protein